MAKKVSCEGTGNFWSIMQTAYIQILSSHQIHRARTMGVREWNSAQCAFLSFSLYIYFFRRTSVAPWTDCWKSNTISGYSPSVVVCKGLSRIDSIFSLFAQSWPSCRAASKGRIVGGTIGSGPSFWLVLKFAQKYFGLQVWTLVCTQNEV